jgi:hypothetical protein
LVNIADAQENKSTVSVRQLPPGWVQASDVVDWVNLTRLKVEGPPHNHWGCEIPAKISSTARATASFRAHFVSTPRAEEIKSILEEYQQQATSYWSDRWGKPNVEWSDLIADGSNLKGKLLWISFPYKPGVGDCGGGGFNDSIISSVGKAFMSVNDAIIKIEFDYAVTGGIKGFMNGSDEEWMTAQALIIRGEIGTLIGRLVISTGHAPQRNDISIQSRTDYALSDVIPNNVRPAVLIMLSTWQIKEGEQALAPNNDIYIYRTEEGQANSGTVVRGPVTIGNNGYVILKWIPDINERKKAWIFNFSPVSDNPYAPGSAATTISPFPEDTSSFKSESDYRKDYRGQQIIDWSQLQLR